MTTTPLTLAAPIVELLPGQPDWHQGLRELPDPPTRLRLAGRMPAFQPPWVAVVGTRHADPDALHFARDLAADLAAAGAVVVSGGARGIDAAAHRGALQSGGDTICVLGTGLSYAYPPENADLLAEIAARGALLTEAEDDWSPRPGLFLLRNRLIAALASAVVVVQAPLRSGALSTARIARSLGRPVYAVPDAPGRARGAGCLWLLRQGAGVCTSARDLIDNKFLRPCLGYAEGPTPIQNQFDFAALDGYAAAVVGCLQGAPATPDRIGRQLDIPINRVQEVLLTLELEGVVRQRADGSYACAR